MAKLYLLISAFFGGTAVIFGAFGAHALRSKLSEPLLASYKTAVQYQMFHALALLGVALLMIQWGQRTALCISGGLFALGTILFAGSLYGLVLGGPRILGPLTPLGGLLLIGGWVALLVAAYTQPAQ
ncbi:MAG: DUF423 domain-containing protein [Gammaproteobacteria bacterium]|nr:DUF423 domain-containing protein [Gammaproteobacteria bacterium]